MSQHLVRKLPIVFKNILYVFLICFSISSFSQQTRTCFVKINADQPDQNSASRKVAGSVSMSSERIYQDWENLDNASYIDGLSISTRLASKKQSKALVFSNFDFNIPNTAYVTGIELQIKGDGENTSEVFDRNISLTKSAGTPTGRDRNNHLTKGKQWSLDTLSNTNTWWYGHTSDRWDASWYGSDINSPGFGVVLQYTNGGEEEAILNIDNLQLIVYYDAPIIICDDHACVPVYTAPDPSVDTYNWSVNGGLVWENVSNSDNVINILSETSSFGTYEVCLEKVYNDGTTENCCRSIVYQDCTTGSVGDFVWEDRNGNGFQDAGEPGITGCRMNLFDESLNLVDYTFTLNGQYVFNNLKPGNYLVQVEIKELVPTQYDPSNQTLNSDFSSKFIEDGSEVFSIGVGEHRRDIDFGFVRPGSIEGIAWIDVDGNGIYDPNVDMVSDSIKVTLLDASGQELGCTYTDSTGTYEFTGVIPGTYSIKFGFGDNFVPTEKGADSQTNDNHCTDPFDVEFGNTTTISAGAYRYSWIGDYVWYDEDEDGIQDPDEEGIPDAKVRLTTCGGTVIQEVITNADGIYEFSDIPPGDYKICVELEDDNLIPTTGINSIKNTDSNFDISTDEHCTECITFTENTKDESYDFGYKDGFVKIDVITFIDTDGDGIPDNGEELIPNSIIEIYACDGTFVASAETDSDGFAWFMGLLSIDYYIKVVPPNGYELADYGFIDNSNGLGTTACYDSKPDGFTLEIPLVKSQISIDIIVFEDFDDDGEVDNDDNRLQNITVGIYSCDGTLIRELDTDDLGGVWFRNLDLGEYYFKINLPDDYEFLSSGYISNAYGPGTTDCYNEDPPGFNLEIGVRAKEENVTITGNVWRDVDGNLINENEDGQDGIVVNLYDCNDNFIASTMSDSQGNFNFSDVPAGSYYFTVEVPFDYGVGIGGDSYVTNSNGENSTDCLVFDEDNNDPIHIAVIPMNSLVSNVFMDMNKNGLRDAVDLDIEGMQVVLRDVFDVEMYSNSTDAEGNVYFDNIYPGLYSLELMDVEDTLEPTIANAGSEDIDSDLIIENGRYVSESFILSNKEHRDDIDFGLITPEDEEDEEEEEIVIRGSVWRDSDGNTLYDSEVNIEGVEISLLECTTGDLVASTVTDPLGAYEFIDVIPGSYYVVVEDNPSFHFAIGGDSDIQHIIANGATDCFDAEPGDIINHLLGLIPLSNIGDYVWLDVNGNGMQDDTDSGLENVEVQLYDMQDQLLYSESTDSDGFYTFRDIAAGYYRLVISGVEDYQPTLLNRGSSAEDSDLTLDGSVYTTGEFLLFDGEDNLDMDLGLIMETFIIGGVVFNDVDKEGTISNADPRLEGMAVELYNTNDDLIASSLTDDAGVYSFFGIIPGDYYVLFDVPSEYLFSEPYASTNEILDSDVIDEDGRTDIITGKGGDVVVGINAGIYKTNACVSGRYWNDRNRNGIYDTTAGSLAGENNQTSRSMDEEGIEDVLVELYAEDGTRISSGMTSADGTYQICNVSAGRYYVVFPIESGFEFSQANQGSDPLIDSDVISSDGSTYIFEVKDGDQIEGINAGVFETSTQISGLVWDDTNFSGTIDNNEVGIENVTVHMLDASGNVVYTTQSDANGNYIFINPIPGDYFIEVERPTEYDDFTFYRMGGDTRSYSYVIRNTGRTDLLEIEEGKLYLNINAGMFVNTTEIAGRVWLDTDEDGFIGTDEFGMESIKVSLYMSNGDLQDEVLTDVTGQYLFTDVWPGEHYIIFDIIDGYTATEYRSGGIAMNDSEIIFPDSGTTQVFFISYGEKFLNINGGLIKQDDPPSNNPQTISGFVWEDYNGDGIYDPDYGTDLIAVNLHSADGTVVETLRTHDDPDTGRPGFYMFNDVVAGDYYLTFELPGGTLATQTGFDSDIAADGRTVDFTISTSPLTNIDAGYYYEASVHGLVWSDTNGDGIYDNDEVGIDQYFVQLFDTLNTEVAFTFTNNAGEFGFIGIIPDRYYVKVNLQLGVSFSPAYMTDPSYDSDISNDNGVGTTSSFDVVSSDLIEDIGVGLITAPATVGDRLWNDENSNGIFDDTESGINGVVVNLYTPQGNIVQSQMTASKGSEDGHYLFEDVTPGQYYVQFDLPAQYTLSGADIGGNDATDSDVDNSNGFGSTSIFELAPGEIELDIDAGVFTSMSVGSFVWHDRDGDGVQDITESGVGDVQVYLFKENGELIEETLTNGIGRYNFGDISAGNYFVQFVLPTNFTFTSKNSGTDSNDSDANPDGTTDVFSLQDGISNEDIDAGLIRPTNIISGLVWHDVDLDGMYTSDEQVMEGATVWLLNSAQTILSETSTGPGGRYVFESISSGQYMIQFAAEPGMGFTAQDQGSDDLIDSDVDVNGISSVLNVTGQTVHRGVNAGLIQSNAPRVSSVFPNPTRGQMLTVSTDLYAGELELSYRLFDMSGNLVKTWTMNKGNSKGIKMSKLDVTDINSGIYLLRVNYGYWTDKHKVIIAND